MSTPSPHPWEPWQLTAYLLGELEADEAQRLASALEADHALAREVAELAATLNDVRAVYHQETLAHGVPSSMDEPTMSALLADEAQKAIGSTPVAPAASARLLATKWSAALPRNVWLSLAALLLIGISLGVLWQNSIQPATSHTMARHDFGNSTFAKQIQEEAANDELEKAIKLRDDSNSMWAEPEGRSFEAKELEITELEATVNPTLADTPVADLLGPASGYGGVMGGYGGMPQAPSAATAPGETGAMGGMLGYGASTEGSSGVSGMSAAGNARAKEPPGALAYGDSDAASYADGSALFGGDQVTMLGGMEGEISPRGNRTSGNVNATEMRPLGSATTTTSTAGSGNALVKGLGRHRLAESDYYGSAFSYPYATGDQFASTPENDFEQVTTAPLSTFSIDVDTASFTKARQYLLEHGQTPPAGAVRIEEFINYFDYDYEGPKDDTPFAAALAVTECPWQPRHKLVRIALQAKKVELSKRPKANLVFLLDVSGSMDEPNKLPLVKESMRLLTKQLGENDRVAMVVYAGAAGCVLESTRGDKQERILSAIERLSAGGSTNGGQGIELAYSLARDHFVPGGINRVILCTDGDFNVGVTSTEALVDLVAENAKSKIFLTVLGYGMGNTNDAMLEQISDRGNGVYGFVDSRREAQRQMVKQLAGNLMTVAKDVKIQVEFNPATVRSYRLVGYENRMLAAEDFNNDKKDAGEIGAGHRVTALYEINPSSAQADEAVDSLKYQPAARKVSSSDSRELLTVKLRYKEPEGDKSSLLTFPLEDSDLAYSDADRDFRWAAAMAEFGMLLRGSQHKGTASWDSVSRRARMAAGSDPDPAREGCLKMIDVASQNSPSNRYSLPPTGRAGDRE